jgi:hypothetical protein
MPLPSSLLKSRGPATLLGIEKDFAAEAQERGVYRVIDDSAPALQPFSFRRKRLPVKKFRT